MTTLSSRLDAEWLRDSPLARLLVLLNQDGAETRVVGGAVRNALIGAKVADIDLATTVLPDEVIRRAGAAGFKTVPTGIAHGTVTVVADGRPFEVTTLRKDVETYGRHAKVVFGRDWRADAQRRDFTMNALSAGADGAIYDYVGGLADLEARRVRFIGTARDRIAEDYLRILRFFRFHAAYGTGEPDPAGLHACIAMRAGLDQLSRERVRAEMIKLLVASRAFETITVMADAGLLLDVLGGVPLLASLARLIAIEGVLGTDADSTRRLGALALFVAEDAERLWRRLRLTNAEHERLASMIERWWEASAAAGGQPARALLYRLGPQRYLDRVLLAWARSSAATDDPAWHALATLPERWIAPASPFRSADFIRRGIERGPKLGAALRAAEAAWIAADFPADRAAIAAIAAAAPGVT